MNEEKEEKKETVTAQKEKEVAKKETATEEVSQKEVIQREKKEPSKQKIEKPKNCMRCNKPIKRKSWYYRSGKFFCSKGCWKLFQKKAA